MPRLRLITAVGLQSFTPRLLIARIAKWGVTGTLTTTLDILLFRALYPVTESVLIANAAGLPIVTSFNYLMHYKWSFNATRDFSSASGRYLTTLLVGFLVNTLLVKLALLAGATPSISKIVAIPIQAPLTFLMFNFWVFHAVEKNPHE